MMTPYSLIETASKQKHTIPPYLYGASGIVTDCFFENLLPKNKLADTLDIFREEIRLGEQVDAGISIDFDDTAHTLYCGSVLLAADPCYLSVANGGHRIAQTATRLRASKTTWGNDIGSITNLLTNGTFETNLTGWTTTNATRDTGEFYEGVASAKIYHASSMGRIQQGVAADTGREYELSFWYKSVDMTHNHRLVVQWYDWQKPGGAGDVLLIDTAAQYFTKSNSWVQKSVKFTAPSDWHGGSQTIQIVIYNYDYNTGYGGGLYVDDIVCLPTHTQYQVIKIGDSTGAAPLAEAERLITADSYVDYVFVGTVESTQTDSASGSHTIHSECRPGYGLGALFDHPTIGGVTNPFYNTETETFDFSYYMANSGIELAEGDWILFDDAINDLQDWSQTDAESVAAYMVNLNAAVASVQEYSTDLRIAISTIIPPTNSPTNFSEYIRTTPLYVYQRRLHALRLAILAEYSGREDENIFIFPIHTCIDPDDVDGVHPYADGYYSMGRFHYAFFKYHA